MTARERLVKLLRREAEETRKAMPSDPPSPTGHRIDVASMRAYADLCETVAAEHAVEVLFEAI